LEEREEEMAGATIGESLLHLITAYESYGDNMIEYRVLSSVREIAVIYGQKLYKTIPFLSLGL